MIARCTLKLSRMKCDEIVDMPLLAVRFTVYAKIVHLFGEICHPELDALLGALSM